VPARMKAAIFVEPNRIVLDEKPIPDVGPLDALIRVTTTTICGTDVHILKGEYPVAPGLTIGHEPVGVIEKLGSAVQGYAEGQRVIAGAICPSGHSNASLCGCHSQDGAGTRHGFKPLGGWRFGNTIDGSQAEYLLVPDAMAKLPGAVPQRADLRAARRGRGDGGPAALGRYRRDPCRGAGQCGDRLRPGGQGRGGDGRDPAHAGAKGRRAARRAAGDGGRGRPRARRHRAAGGGRQGARRPAGARGAGAGRAGGDPDRRIRAGGKGARPRSPPMRPWATAGRCCGRARWSRRARRAGWWWRPGRATEIGRIGGLLAGSSN
jgi:hypothetical protein